VVVDTILLYVETKTHFASDPKLKADNPTQSSA